MLRFSTLLGAVMMMTAVVATPVMADELGGGQGFKTKAAGQFLVRVRAVGVLPEGGDAIKTAGGVDTMFRTRVDDNFIPEVDLSYFITDNIAVEAIAGYTKHRVTTQTGISAGDVYLLPPTITAQYHFFTKERISPYVGAGLNYTILFGETGGLVQPVKFSNSFGPALQAGIDIALTGNWSLNLDVKKIWMSSDFKLANAALKGTANLDPWLVGVGIGYRF